MPYLKSVLAEAMARDGSLDAALSVISETLAQVERQGDGEAAETQLRSSIDCARQQQAKSWELRGSTTRAALLSERGEREAARMLLAPIYNSTTGSPKASTRTTSRRPTNFWSLWTDWASQNDAHAQHEVRVLNTRVRCRTFCCCQASHDAVTVRLPKIEHLVR